MSLRAGTKEWEVKVQWRYLMAVVGRKVKMVMFVSPKLGLVNKLIWGSLRSHLKKGIIWLEKVETHYSSLTPSIHETI